MDSLHYARAKPLQRRRSRWLPYVFGAYVLISGVISAAFLLEPSFRHAGHAPRVTWSLHLDSPLRVAAVFMTEYVMAWYGVSAFPWYLLGFFGALRSRGRGHPGICLRVATIAGLGFFALEVALTTYLTLVTPLVVSTSASSGVVLDGIEWGDETIELGAKYLPFILCAATWRGLLLRRDLRFSRRLAVGPSEAK